jgi:hypothetical protein
MEFKQLREGEDVKRLEEWWSMGSVGGRGDDSNSLFLQLCDLRDVRIRRRSENIRTVR